MHFFKRTRAVLDASFFAFLQGVWTAELVSRPRVLTPHFFSERCEALDGAASAQVVEALRGASLLNETGFLLEDPRCAAHGTGGPLS